MKRIRIGIVGAGPMGRLHARTVRRLAENDEDCVLSVIVDHHAGRAESLAKEFEARASNELEAAVSELDVAVICVPTAAHFAIAKELLERDVDLLVEKPFTSSIDEGSQLGSLARERRRVLQVGHVEWYNQGWREAARRAGSPRSIRVERLNPPSDRGLDLDVVQDLMLHDLDWVSRLLDEEIIEIKAHGRAVLNQRLDEAEATLRFRTGCLVTLRASRVHSTRRRRVRIEGQEGVATADLITRSVSGPGWETGPGRDPLEAQWADFLESVRTRKLPQTDAGVGVAALKLVDRVRDAIDETSWSLDREDDSALSG